MRISDWSSDVCSSDLTVRRRFRSRDFCNLRWLCALQHGPIARSDRMADDRNEVGVPERARINLSEDYEIRDWTKSLGVSEDELRAAVDAVGNSADKVREYLQAR